MTIFLNTPDWAPGTGLPDLVISPLTHLGMIRISGEQAESFIQGQVTSDINGQQPNEWHWGAHCDPKGKMLASFRSVIWEDDILFIMPKDTVDIDLPQLQKYAVFNKVELTDASDKLTIIGIAGKNALEFVQQNFGTVTENVTCFDNKLLVKDNERFMLIVPTDQQQDILALAPEAAYEHKVWQGLEILAGYPNIGAHHSGQYVPQMCNLQAINGISFNKGCYMGQETVARMKYRGGNKRALYIASGEANILVNDSSQLEIQLEDDNYRRGGNVIESVQTGNQLLLTAVLPNDTGLEAKLRIAGDDTSILKLLPLPYSLED